MYSKSAILDREYDDLRRHYELLEELEPGAFSTVFKVAHVSDLNKHYACKVFQKCYFGSKSGVIEEELKHTLNATHPNLTSHLKIIQGSPGYSYLYIVMALATGGELLHRVIDVGTVTERYASSIIAQVLDACDFLHYRGIVHRDIKPDNLLFKNLAPDSPIMLTGFGLAAFRDHVDRIEILQGCRNFYFFSPEILLRKPYDCKADLWSIGAIVFVLLSGYLPFFSFDYTKFSKDIVSANFDFHREEWESVTQSAKEFISKLMSKEPSSRPTAAEALKHVWIAKNETDIVLDIKENLKESSANLKKSKELYETKISQRLKQGKSQISHLSDREDSSSR